MKPLMKGSFARLFFVCPVCEYTEVMEDEDGEFAGVKHNYCPDCGQNLQADFDYGNNEEEEKYEH